MRQSFLVRTCVALFIILIGFMPTRAASSTPYQTTTTRWRAPHDGFGVWERSGVSLLRDGRLTFDPGTSAAESDPYPTGGYYGGNFYTGGTYRVGEAISPAVTTPFAFKEAIASWNAVTPPGSWIEIQVRVQQGTAWTKWYNMGVWSADSSTVRRHSVAQQDDGDGKVSVDTLVLNGMATAFQAKARLFSANGNAVPAIFSVAVTVSTTPSRPANLVAGNEALWNRSLPVPQCSQMVYEDGGEVWCSPTSLSMVLEYWRKRPGPCAPRVHATVAGVYDWRFDGHGNWPFNVAYASTQGMEGYVTRFASLRDVEPWIAAGIPVIMSFGWQKGTLTGAPASSSSGHLVVLTGFDVKGNPIINDPYSPHDSTVRRPYLRREFEPLWLEHSGGTAYLVYPRGFHVPR